MANSKRARRAQGKFRSEQFQIDLAHVDRMTPAERRRVMEDAEAFLTSLGRRFNELYLHLDVDRHKEQLRGVPRYHWRALLTTDNGRYYAEDADFGVAQALNRTLDALDFEISSRMDRLAEQERGSTIGIS